MGSRPTRSAKPDLSRFERRVKPRRSKCWFGRLSPEQQQEVEAARAAGYQLGVINEVLKEDFGLVVKAESSLSNHFSRKCGCG